MNFAQVLFSFSGRINRGKYWAAVVFWLVVVLAASGIVAVLVGRGVSDFSADDIGAGIAALGAGLVVIAIVLIPMFISYLAVGIKRLHDRDKSGWWIVLFYFGPTVLSAIGGTSESELVATALSLAGFAILIWGIVELGFLRGTVGPNQYGPDPLPPVQVAAAH